jgi:hypothetical protein
LTSFFPDASAGIAFAPIKMIVGKSRMDVLRDVRETRRRQCPESQKSMIADLIGFLAASCLRNRLNPPSASRTSPNGEERPLVDPIFVFDPRAN